MTGVTGAEMVQVSSASLQVTSDPAVFSEELAKIGLDNEVMVALKDASEPGVSLERFSRPDVAGLVGLPDRDAGTFTRGRPFANASTASRRAVVTALEGMGAEVYRKLQSPIIHVRLPDAVRTDAVALLLHHPNVDYIQPNRGMDIVFDGPSSSRASARPIGAVAPVGGPEGTNKLDVQHTFHGVADTNAGIEDAWDYSRGSNVIVGILDSGLAPNHPDGQGIWMRGFVNDYGNCSSTQQANGECFAEDDDPGRTGGPTGGCIPDVDPDCCPVDDDCCEEENPDNCIENNSIPGHGTQMAGLVGADDNNIDIVGIAPDALVVSMKITCHLEGCTVFQEDDLSHAIDWARGFGVNILSMSWTLSNGMSPMLVSKLEAAYNDGILLLSATGNDNPDHRGGHPQSLQSVMGVGGVDLGSNSVFFNEEEEIAALSTGRTLLTPDRVIVYDSIGGGTSASTAVVAGIAALVMGYNRGMTGSQVRTRLKETATQNPDSSKTVNALLAVKGLPPPPPPLSVQIEGDFLVRDHYTCTWTAEVSGGVSPYTYQWFRDGVAVDPDGDEEVVELDTEEEAFELEVRVEDAAGTVKVADEGVSVTQSAPICEGGLGT